MDSGLRSPIDVEGQIKFKNFKVEDHFDYSTSTIISKTSDHVFKMDGNFGYVGYEGVKHQVLYSLFKAPSDHLIAGERMPLELQIVAKNDHGDHLTISVLFRITHDPNYMMGLLGFGKGILGNLDNDNYKNPKTHNISELAVTLKPFLINQGSWIMYEGSGLSPPCSMTTWLMSMEPLTVTEQQLSDFALGARPDFTIKTIGNRTIFTNKLNDNDVDAKKLKELEHRETEIMLDRMRAKKEEAKVKEKLLEQARKEKEEKLRQAVFDYRKKKDEILFHDPPKVGNDPLITENLLSNLIKDVSEYNEIHTPCKNYSKYLPPIDKEYGYVPADAVMVWELQSFNDKHKNISISSEPLPKPVNTSYEFQPFYYVPKEDCHAKNENSSIKQLARLTNKLDIATGNATEYIPVIVETDPAYAFPARPAITVRMAVPGRKPELQDVVVNRKTVPNLSKFPEQDLEAAKTHSLTSGYIVNQDIKRPYYPVPGLQSPVDSRGRVIRVWPEFNTIRDGSVPEDAIYAWQGIKESKFIVLNVTVPKSFDPEYRWIIFMYLPCNYTMGDDETTPLIPVFILARNEFNYTKDKVPDSIPVPATTDKVEGLIRAEQITIQFMALSSIQILKDPRILEKPIGYDLDQIFTRADTYRRQIFLLQAKQNPHYFNQTHEYYIGLLSMPEGGRPEELERAEKERVTGIFVLPDPEYRQKRDEEMKQSELELLQRLKKESDRNKRLEAIWTDPDRIIRYEKVCIEWGIDVILNDRTTQKDMQKQTKDMKRCIAWNWSAISGKNELQKSANNTPNGTKTDDDSMKKEIAKKKIVAEIENYCLTKVHVVLNDRSRESKDKHYELCKSTLDNLKKADITLFMSSLGPALNTLKEHADATSEKLQRAATILKENLVKTKDSIADSLNKEKHVKPTDFTIMPPQLAKRSNTVKMASRKSANKPLGYLNRLVSFADRVWTTTLY